MDLSSSEKRKQKISQRQTSSSIPMTPRYATPPSLPAAERPFGLELTLQLTEGLGLSLIGSTPEELLYCRLSGIFISCQLIDGKYMLGGHVVEIQVG